MGESRRLTGMPVLVKKDFDLNKPKIALEGNIK
jgi:hypothetical protein